MGQHEVDSVTLLSCASHSDDVCSSGRQVELMLGCNGLVARDSTCSSQAPMCVLYQKQFGQWAEFARTEPVLELVNPKFTQTAVIDYFSDIQQRLLIVVCRSTSSRREDPIGMTELLLSSLISDGQSISTTASVLRLPGDADSRGWLHVSAEVVRRSPCKLELHVGASKLRRASAFSFRKFDTYLEVGRSINSVNFHPVYRSEVVKKCQSPRWRPFELGMRTLCNSQLTRPIMFSCWQVTSDSEARMIGNTVTTVQQLQEHRWTKCFKTFALETPRSQGEGGHKHNGTLRVIRCRLDMQYNLLDFVRGGCSCNFIVAIDFTSSNGDPSKETSLHYQHARSNPYSAAIETLGSVLSRCDLSQRFAAFGFGASHKGDARRRHCFALNGDQSDPTVDGIKGVLDAYRAIVPDLVFGGPSRLEPVMRHVMRSVDTKPTQEVQTYSVLLVVTDGVVNDLDSVLVAVGEARPLPLSVVVAGVGPADFSMMDSLEHLSDGRPKRHTTSHASSRDNVQFVPIHKQMSTAACDILCREALARVSRQMTSYMQSRAITPQRPSPGLAARLPLHFPGAHGERSDCPGRLTLGPGGMSAGCADPTAPSCPTCGATLTPGDRPK